jgi:putative membrane protein
MTDHTYQRFTEGKKDELTLRDYLAVDRTIMANETSFMSYIRTSLTVVVAGVSIIHFFGGPLMTVLGWLFIAAAALLFVHGATRYDSMEQILHRITGELTDESTDEHRANLAKRFLLATQGLIRLMK